MDFSGFAINTTPSEFQEIALASGLVGADRYPEETFRNSFSLRSNILGLQQPDEVERLAQITADFLRIRLLDQQERFSFETVFSHPSKIEFMRQAALAGYKVYLYFVSTESPDINIFRVKARHVKGGHDVPPDTIRSRYYRSLDLLYEAAQLSYQAFFFDNSKDGEDMKMFAHFKQVNGIKAWDDIDRDDVPDWFIRYYSSKVRSNG